MAPRLAFFCVLGAASLVSAAFASTDLKPSWARPPSGEWADNCSFLNDLKRDNSEFRSFPAMDEILDLGKAAELRRQFEEASRNYELKRSYDLSGMQDVQAYNLQMTQLSYSVLDHMKDVQTQRNLKRVNEAVKRDEKLNRFRKPVMVIGATAAVFYMGKPVDFNLTETTKLRTRANVHLQVGEVEVLSPLLSGSVRYSARAPKSKDYVTPAPYTLTAIDPNEEQYRFSLARSLPVLDIASAVSYGSTSNTLTASLMRPLIPNLTGVFESARPVNSNRSILRRAEETLRLLYVLHF